MIEDSKDHVIATGAWVYIGTERKKRAHSWHRVLTDIFFARPICCENMRYITANMWRWKVSFDLIKWKGIADNSDEYLVICKLYTEAEHIPLFAWNPVGIPKAERRCRIVQIKGQLRRVIYFSVR